MYPIGAVVLRTINNFFYISTHYFIQPLGRLLLWLKKPHTKSILHISYNVHICLETVSLLRDTGHKTGYLAVSSPSMPGPDKTFIPSRIGIIRAIQEWLILIHYIGQYEIIHTHFGLGISREGWEFLALRNSGRKIVWHHRGCSSRDMKINEILHPEPIYNICFKCDYNGKACSGSDLVKRRQVLKKVAHKHIVTTPDLKDFYPNSVHIPFFSPTEYRSNYQFSSKRDYQLGETLRIVQITNHPGIEGAYEVQNIIDQLKAKGYQVDYKLLSGISPQESAQELTKADLSIGKMKMGYYANNQIESLALGTPCITYIRSDFMTPGLNSSAFILTDLSQLAQTLESIIKKPEILMSKRKLIPEFLTTHHSNQNIIDLYNQIYDELSVES